MLEREPIYEPLREHPEFQAMMAEIKADMTVQLAELRKMEQAGEIASIPQSEANFH